METRTRRGWEAPDHSNLCGHSVSPAPLSPSLVGVGVEVYTQDKQDAACSRRYKSVAPATNLKEMLT